MVSVNWRHLWWHFFPVIQPYRLYFNNAQLNCIQLHHIHLISLYFFSMETKQFSNTIHMQCPAAKGRKSNIWQVLNDTFLQRLCWGQWCLYEVILQSTLFVWMVLENQMLWLDFRDYFRATTSRPQKFMYGNGNRGIYKIMPSSDSADFCNSDIISWAMSSRKGKIICAYYSFINTTYIKRDTLYMGISNILTNSSITGFSTSSTIWD